LKLLLLVLVLAVLVPLGLAFLRRRGLLNDENRPWPFYAKRLLTPPEQILYHRLVRALPDHVVLAQVQVSRVLGVKKGFKFHEWNNRINRLSYDFVVCTKDATVLAAIELDDRSHDEAERAGTDAKKERATAAARVRLIRWNVKSLPDQAAIQAAFAPEPIKPALEPVAVAQARDQAASEVV